MENLIIVGTSTTARRVLSFVEKHRLYRVIGFAVNKPYLKETSFCGYPVYAIEELDTVIDKNSDKLFVAILWNRLNADRRLVYENLKSQGFRFANLISPLATLYSEISGDNCWISDGAIINQDVTIGYDTFIKEQAFVGSDSRIGNHCYIAIHAVVAGDCTVGDQSFIGINSVVFDCTSVGNKCIVGACASVKRNMPDFSKYQASADATEFKQYDESIVESKLMFSKNVRTNQCNILRANGFTPPHIKHARHRAYSSLSTNKLYHLVDYSDIVHLAV